MNTILRSLLLPVVICLFAWFADTGELNVVPVVQSGLDRVHVALTPVDGQESLALQIDLPNESDLWVSIYAEAGCLLQRQRLSGKTLEHMLYFNYLSGQSFQVNVSYVYGGLLHVARVQRAKA